MQNTVWVSRTDEHPYGVWCAAYISLALLHAQYAYGGLPWLSCFRRRSAGCPRILMRDLQVVNQNFGALLQGRGVWGSGSVAAELHFASKQPEGLQFSRRH